MTFKDFLDLHERAINMEIDPEDPIETRQKIAIAHRNPNRAARQNAVDAQAAKRQAQKEHDPIAAKIAQLRSQIAQLEMRQARNQKAEAPTPE